MRFCKVLFPVLLVCGAPLSMSSQTVDVPSAVVSALNSSNSIMLSNYLSGTVELSIGNQDDIYSNQQSTAILTDFFRKNHVLSFQVLHKGNKESASFLIGMLKTNNGVFRVYILSRKSQIQQLRIDPSND
jgi:Domain of unknown function (DUF4783)